MVLTNTICKNAKHPPDTVRLRLADSGGLYLEMVPTGSKEKWLALEHMRVGVKTLPFRAA